MSFFLIVKSIMILTEQVRVVPLVNYYVIEVVYESVEVKLNLSEYDQDLRNGTIYSGNILKMIIFGAIYSGTA